MGDGGFELIIRVYPTMSRLRKEDEFPELEGVMFISAGERAKAEKKIREQRAVAEAAKAEAAKAEEVCC